jgi:virginiamycin B lyase
MRLHDLRSKLISPAARKRADRICIAASFLFFAACSGGASGPPATNVGGGKSNGTLDLHFATPTADAVTRRRYFLSPSAVSVAITMTGDAAPVVANIAAGSAACTTSANGRTCAIPLTAEVGNDTFTVTLYAGPNSTGSVLGTGTASQTVVAGTPFTVSVGVIGSVSSIKLSAPTIQFVPGTAKTVALTVVALDAGGNVIAGTYGSPIELTNTDTSGEFTVSPASVTGSGTPVTLTYNGAVTVAKATIAATATGVTAADVAPQIVYAGTPALTFTELALPSGSIPNQFSPGPDGNEWYATNGITTRGVGRIALAGSAIGAITEAAFPPDPTDGAIDALGVTGAKDGNLYATNGACTVFKVTPLEAISVLYSMPSCQSPGFLTQGPDGALWVILYANGANAIGRFPLSGAAPNVYPLPNPDACDSYACQIVTGPDGALWFTELSSGVIGRITTSGVIKEFPLHSGAIPEGITVGTDGALWFCDRTMIGRITTTGAVTEYPLPNGGTNARGIATGVDGNMYFSASVAVGKVSTAGAIALYSAGGNGDSGDSLASGPNGDLFTVIGTGNATQPYNLLVFPPQ